MMTDQLIISQDPDGFGCYSDHANDIQTKGACDFCDSTDEDVVGHVLPDVDRYIGKDPVQAAAIVLHRKGASFFDGILLDAFSAGAIQAVYNALSTDSARAKLRAMTFEQAVSACFKVIKKSGETQHGN